MSNPIGHVEVLGDDPDRLREFYGSVFAWEIGAPDEDDPEANDYAMVFPEERPEGVSAGIGRRLPERSPVSFYVRVTDLQGTLDVIEKRGGRTVSPLRVGPETEIARFSDPAGNVIGLMKL